MSIANSLRALEVEFSGKIHCSKDPLFGCSNIVGVWIAILIGTQKVGLPVTFLASERKIIKQRAPCLSSCEALEWFWRPSNVQCYGFFCSCLPGLDGWFAPPVHIHPCSSPTCWAFWRRLTEMEMRVENQIWRIWSSGVPSKPRPRCSDLSHFYWFFKKNKTIPLILQLNI